MLSAIVKACRSYFNHIKETSKNFTKPETAVLVADTVSDITRSRKDLVTENAILRQQLIVLNRQVKRPKFADGDRLGLVLLSRLTQFWNSALYLVQPDTLLRWHHDLFRCYWKRKSKSINRKPRIPQETIDLIKEMVQKNWLRGAEKIQGEVLKLDIKVSERTIQKYMKKVRKRSSQNWRTFLRNHAHEIWTCHFTTMTTLLLNPPAYSSSWNLNPLCVQPELSGSPPPTPLVPAAQTQNTAENQKARSPAENGNSSTQDPQTVENPPVVKSAEHWRREARTATKSLMFDTAVSRLEPWFKDAAAAGAFRDTLCESWEPKLVGFYLEAMLVAADHRWRMSLGLDAAADSSCCAGRPTTHRLGSCQCVGTGH
jgi:hypothetical protein